MLAARGGPGILLGLVVLRVGVGELVVLFGSYALLDGIWAVCWAVRASRRPRVAVGIVALGFPFEAAAFVHMIARGEWSSVCSKSSRRCVSPSVTGHWALAAAGAWSIFLAVLILRLPHAVTDSLVNVVGVYALTFGVLVSAAAILIRYGDPRVVVPSPAHTWTTR